MDKLNSCLLVDPVIGFEYSQQSAFLQWLNKRWICGLVPPIHVVRYQDGDFVEE